MALSTVRFNNILSDVDEFSTKQAVGVLLQMRSVSAGDMPPIDEAVACITALREEEIIECLKIIKQQFSEADWEIILELL